MLWIYNIGIAFYGALLKIVSIFNSKAKLFVAGRKNIFEHIAQAIDPSQRPIWFHFASLGEFEQGRPVLEQYRSIHADTRIVVTFFSPSGYEIRKNYALANVFYLPLDTAANAKRFIELVNPAFAVFTKYEFWYHYFKVLHQKQIPLYLISGIFRPNQLFFKWHGGFYREILGYVSHFFVQNEQSEQLLHKIGFDNVTVSGDTRFDRVFENAQNPKQWPEIAAFCGESPVFIAGSTWPADEKLIANLVVAYPDWKLIIAPHEIGADHVEEIEQLFPTAIKFSSLSGQLSAYGEPLGIPVTADAGPQTLIIDNIGMLSSLYPYAKLAYIGGGFGAGIHNTLEAAAFGLSVIFGPNYKKFQEAKDLIAIGAAKSIVNAQELTHAFEQFKDNRQAAETAKAYVSKKKGATPMILSKIA
ncbi:MAG: glycosyltransferase N-terminal domain-containing protein [Pedobacter sp.]|nr:glycosyltransferase N-terminal domain-containing protein [Pedobacter sp.]MDQ8053459.1 glycosyltransferase N-terminal domain-containing protein [Pedobacter sp.]